jgi:hypothetical protein
MDATAMASSLTASTVQPPLGEPPDLRDAKPPVAIPNVWLWVWIGLGTALLAAGAITALVLWLRRRNAPAPPAPTPPHIRARHRLAEALRLIQDPNAFCTEVSAALRDYLEERFDFHAPERTTEEFLVELRATSRLAPAQKTSLGAFLESCDLVKFAKFEPPESALRELHECALRLVDETRFDPLTPAAPPPGPPPMPSPPPVPRPTAGSPA